MKFVPNAVSSKLALTILKTQKHSPKILFVAGAAGTVTAAVLAARATLKLEEVLEETSKDLDRVRTLHHVDYSEADRTQDKAVLYIRGGVKVVKLYAPAVAVGALSIGMLTGSHYILSKRNAALTAAYATLEKGFSSYRARVVEDQGEDKDRQYLHGSEKQKFTTIDEKGKKVKGDRKVATDVSPYGVLFNDRNPNWNRNAEYNYIFLRAQLRYLNDQLRSRGHVFLNDVYDALGFERTSQGAVVGWLADGRGDGYIDFGIFDDDAALRVHDFLVGNEGELYLDFNVDGLIYKNI